MSRPTDPRDPIDPQLSAQLDAWRRSSLRDPRRHARDRARDAMLEALVAQPPRRRWNAVRFRPRFGHAGLIAVGATVVAAVSVAAAGWNAPPGSALFVVRSARQGVMLKLPGSDDAALHLEFAEQSLADVRDRVNPTQSISDARTELAAAFAELPSDRTSTLWLRYRADESTLIIDESELENEEPSASPGSVAPPPTDEETPTGAAASPSPDNETPEPRTAGPAPSGSGDDHGKRSPSPGPSGTPHPDN